MPSNVTFSLEVVSRDVVGLTCKLIYNDVMHKEDQPGGFLGF